MRMRTRWFVVAVAVVAAAAVGSGRVDAQPAKKAEPTVEVRLRSVNDLLDRGEYLGGLVGKEDFVRQGRELIKTLSAEGKGVEGVDPKRPFGAYATIKTDIANSSVVVMVPIADRDRFLQMLKERLSVEPEKGDDGTLKANVPLLNDIVLRFANDYLYIGRTAKDLNKATLPTPKAFFATDDGSALSVLVRIDRIPADLKTAAIGQFELAVQRALMEKGGTNPVTRKIASFMAEGFVGTVKDVIEDGKHLSIKVFVDPKADDLTAELVLTAKDGTALAKQITGLEGKTSIPAGIVGTKGAVVGTARLGLTADGKKQLASTVDEIAGELVKQVGQNERELVKRVLGTLTPTLKAGELDAAVSVSGPDAKGRYVLLGAAAIKGGKEIEKLAKDLATLIPGNAGEFTFDAEKVGAFSLHKIEIKQGGDELERIFGSKTIWMATTDDHIAVSFGPDASALKQGLKAQAASVPLLGIDVSVSKLIPLLKPGIKADELKAVMKDVFGGNSPSGKDTVTVRVTGGTALTGKMQVKGSVIRLFHAMDQLGIK